ncbi:MAG: hypothetical protein Q4F79_04960 [Eubacteriales bacterium]|nr:hypothetical protein [Eubacteriales bacterium]
MRKQRITSSLCASALLLSLTACGASTQNNDYSGETVTGRVTEIDGETVTLQLGELGQGGQEGAPSDGEQPPEQPGNMASSEADGSGEAPEDPPTNSDENTPPEKPDGDSNGEAPSGDSDGEAPSGDPPEQLQGSGMSDDTSSSAQVAETVTIDLSDAEITTEADGESTAATLDDIAVDDMLVVEFDDNGKAETVTIQTGGGQPGGFSGGSGEVTQGTSANTLDTDTSVSGETYSSDGDDENALRVDGAVAELGGITVEKSGGSSSNTEDGDFYGQNAALLATNGAEVTIQNATVSSSAQNGNGVFSYGEGTTVNISDSTITTEADNSGGIQTTGGGTTNASNLTVTTSGSSSAAIRSDRGGGTVSVDGGSYTSNGYNSPAVYSTADITVKNAVLTANNSEALVIEGQNSIALEDCDVTGNMSDTEGTSSDENVHNVMIYQSMSGDAEVGTASFSMNGGSLTSQNGDLFYITNTACQLSLTNVSIDNQDADGYLMRISGNSASRGWGSAGSNGAQAEVSVSQQTLEGDIVVDSISTLNLTLSDESTLNGSIQIVDNEQDGTAVDDNVVLTIEEGCTWTLTDDCTISSLTNNGTIDFNGHTITLADGTVLSE